MDEPTNTTPATPGSPRRRVLQGGLVAGSVALFASTHRALAGGKCKLKKWSGYQSSVKKAKKGGKKTTGASASPGAAFCPGKSASWWVSNTSHWPSPYTTGMHFNSSTCFGSGSSSSLLTILKGSDSPAKQFCAALLSAGSSTFCPNFPYHTTDVKFAWSHGSQSAYQSYYRDYLLTG